MGLQCGNVGEDFPSGGYRVRVDVLQTERFKERQKKAETARDLVGGEVA